MALKDLEHACNVLMSCSFFDTRILSMRNYLICGGLRLEDIELDGREVTEQRIKEFKIKNRKAYSKLKIKILRKTTSKAFANNPDFFSNYLIEILQYIDEVGLSLKEIGSSEEELKKFRIEIAKARAKEALKKVIKILDENDLTFEDLGVTMNRGKLVYSLQETSSQPQS